MESPYDTVRRILREGVVPSGMVHGGLTAVSVQLTVMAIDPEVLPPDSRRNLRRFALLLDSAVTIPGTKITVGLDSLLGLLPGVGDAFGSLLSSVIIVQAAREGVSSFVLLRMILNLVTDSILGAIPIVGDLFDLVWRANLKNVELLERSPSVVPPGPQNTARLVWILAILLLIVTATVIGGIVLLVRLLT